MGSPRQTRPSDRFRAPLERAYRDCDPAVYPLAGRALQQVLRLASVWRVLHQAGRLSRWRGKPSNKGKGFQQPAGPHQHWHVDISYLNLAGTFYYLCSVLDGYSRYLVHWEIRESMTEAEVEIILQRAREQLPEVRLPPHFRQRAAVHCSRLQRVYPDLRHDSCADLAVLSAVKRENREVAPIVK